MKELIILIGNIGTGKSYMCKSLVEEGYVIISKDDVRYSMGAGKYIFNPDYEEAIHMGVINRVYWLSQTGVRYCY